MSPIRGTWVILKKHTGLRMQAVGHYWKRFPNKAIEYKHKYKTASCRIGRSDGINREFMKTNFKQKIIEQARREDLQVTALREQVLDIVLQQSGVIKAYNVLSQMQQQSEGVLAPPTAYRALDFWADQGVLHKVAAVNGYILCSHAQHECNDHCHDHEEAEAHHSAFILVCTECGAADEQTLSHEWAALRAGVAESGFALKEEHVVLTGICKNVRSEKNQSPPDFRFSGNRQNHRAQKPDGAKDPNEKWVIIVNEFGEIGIDGAVLSDNGIPVAEIAGGCLCCTAGPQMGVTVQKMLRDAKPDRLMIEASGLAHAASVIDELKAKPLDSLLEIGAVFTVVDPRQFINPDYAQQALYKDQIGICDVLAAGKTDLCTPEQLAEFHDKAAKLFPPKAKVVEVQNAQLDIQWLDIPVVEKSRYRLKALPDNTMGFQSQGFHIPRRTRFRRRKIDQLLQ